jgi:hypothetical protein
MCSHVPALVQYGIDKFLSNRFTRPSVLSSLHKLVARERAITFMTFIVVMIVVLLRASSSFAATQGLNQIATPDLPPEGELSLSFQAQPEKLGNPHQLQAEMGLTKRFEIAIFKGFKPNELIFATEIGLLMKEPYLLSVGFSNWSPHSHVDPQPYIEAGYWGEHHKFAVGVARADFRNEAILGYAYDFNDTWRLQVDFQSGSGNSSTIGFVWSINDDCQITPAIYVTNDSPHEVLGYISFTYTFHVWGGRK